MGRSSELVSILDDQGMLMVKKDKNGGRVVVFILDMSALAPRAAPEPNRERSKTGEERRTVMQLLCIELFRDIATDTSIAHEVAPHTKVVLLLTM